MRDTKAILILLSVLVFLSLGMVLRLLETILLPFVVAVFLSQIFTPLTAALRARRVPAAVSIVVVLITVSAALMVFSWVLYSSAQSFNAALPRYQARLTSLLSGVYGNLAASFPQLRDWHWEQAVEASAITGFVAAWLGSFLLFFNDMFLVLLFLVFLLAGTESFPHKLNRAFAANTAERVSTVMRNIEEQVRKYLVTKTLVNLANGTLVTLLLAAFGVDFPLFWGFITFLAHYIPNVGSVLSVGLPTLFLFLQFESPAKALLIAALNLALQFVIGNVIEPRIMGSSLDLSPLLVLLSLIFWGWLWGAWGMVLAVPMTSTIKIVCENVPSLRPLAVLMGGGAAPVAPVSAKSAIA
jgi:predicted PurR-regulated permease PerM